MMKPYERMGEMKTKKVNVGDVLAELRNKVWLHTRGQTGLAEDFGVSVSFLNDVLRGRREITDRILEPMGYYWHKSIKPIKTKKADK
jgi:plasmid maintenance system antidote protein VapI